MVDTESIEVNKATAFIFKGTVGDMTLNFKIDGCETEEDAKVKLINVLESLLTQLKS